MQQEKILRAECSWTNLVNALQEAIHSSFIKSCIYCFSLWYEFFVLYALRAEKIYQHSLNAGPLEFQFLWPRGKSDQPIHNSVAFFQGHRQNNRSHLHNNFVKKIFVCISHHDNDLPRCASLFPLLRCQGVWKKTSIQLSLSQILFQNPKNYSLWDVQRFCHHSWKDSTVIFNQISNSSNVYLSSSWFWIATSLVIFYQLPSISKLRIPPKNVYRFKASFL